MRRRCKLVASTLVGLTWGLLGEVHGGDVGAASNPGFKLEVLEQAVVTHFGAERARDGHRFLVLDTRITNVISADLVFAHDVPQRVELASLRRKVFLHWGGSQVCTLNEKRQRDGAHLPNNIVLKRHGAKVRGKLVFEIPGEKLQAASLHYFHDAFGPVEIPLGGGGVNPGVEPEKLLSNQNLRLAVKGVERRTSWEGTKAPEGKVFAVVKLVGEGGFDWTTRAAMLSEEAVDPDGKATFRLPFEYFEARLSLYLVVDGDVAIPYERELSGGADTLTFLPGRWCEYVLVYAIPKSVRSLALEALFGRMGLGYEKGTVLAPLVFELEGKPPEPTVPEGAVRFVDQKDGYTFDVSVSDLVKSATVHSVTPDEGEAFLSMTVRVRYSGPEAGRDALQRRFFLLLPGGLHRPVDPATFEGDFPPLPEFSFAPGTRRRFDLVFALPQDLERATLNFSGPAQVHQVPLSLTPAGIEVSGSVVQHSTLEIERQALVRRDADGNISAAEELASDVRRPRPENIKPEWHKKWAVRRDSPDAALAVRVGDIDNFGFGWPDGYDPFSGETIKSHPYPWQPDPRDPPGTDRIMVVTGYEGKGAFDGYTSGTKRPLNKVQDVVFSFAPDGIQIDSAKLRMFLDDLQPGKLGSHFQFTIDGVRLPLIEAVINTLSQTGPVGKMLTVAVPVEALYLLADGEISVRLDDPETGVGDGFAIDFVELLINPREAAAGGTIRGTVLDAASGGPLAGVLVSAAGLVEVESGTDGSFSLEGVPAGLSVISASKVKYRTATVSRDLAPGKTESIEFRLARESAGDTLMNEGRVVVRGIRFDSDSARLKPESEAVLRDLLQVLARKGTARFRVTGHTDAEGSNDYNLRLSKDRAQAVVAWFLDHGIGAERLQAEGFGESQPVSTNGSETGRALNRRVEIEELKK